MAEHPSIPRLRELCLAYPEAVEQETWGRPTFRVRARIFAMCGAHDGRPALWCRDEVDGLVEESYRMTAPARLRRAIGEG